MEPAPGMNRTSITNPRFLKNFFLSGIAAQQALDTHFLTPRTQSRIPLHLVLIVMSSIPTASPCMTQTHPPAPTMPPALAPHAVPVCHTPAAPLPLVPDANALSGNPASPTHQALATRWDPTLPTAAPTPTHWTPTRIQAGKFVAVSAQAPSPPAAQALPAAPTVPTASAPSAAPSPPATAPQIFIP